MKKDVLGVQFDDLTLNEAVEKAMMLLESADTSYIVTPNPEIVWLCRKDEKLKRAVSDAALVLPDGIGVLYGAKILGRPLKEKIPGIDFAAALFEKTTNAGKGIYLLGAKPGIAELAAQNLEKEFPGIRISGISDGYFTDDKAMVDQINNTNTDVLLVCLGAPKQEIWMAEQAAHLNARLLVGLGGSLDVFSGTVERAPLSWQKSGLEWLYRLKKEPWRMKRMIKLPIFIFAVIGQRILRK